MSEVVPCRDELVAAIREIRNEYPEFGVKRIWGKLKETKTWELSEKRVQKLLKEEPTLNDRIVSAVLVRDVMPGTAEHVCQDFLG